MYKFEYDMIVIVKKTCRKIAKRREKMKLSALTSESLITLNNDLQTKEDVIRTLISMLYKEGKITDEEKFLAAVMEREEVTPTGIDSGLAIPHGKSSAVKEASFAVMTLNKPILNWESVDRDK